MIINNQVIHTYEIAALLSSSWGFDPLPEHTYKIKFNGKFIRINNKSEWDRVGSAKNAFKSYLRRYSSVFYPYVNKNTTYNASDYYRCDKNDLDGIYNQLLADNMLEFVEINN
jgi:hypothetical protein